MLALQVVTHSHCISHMDPPTSIVQHNEHIYHITCNCQLISNRLLSLLFSCLGKLLEWPPVVLLDVGRGRLGLSVRLQHGRDQLARRRHTLVHQRDHRGAHRQRHGPQHAQLAVGLHCSRVRRRRLHRWLLQRHVCRLLRQVEQLTNQLKH